MTRRRARRPQLQSPRWAHKGTRPVPPRPTSPEGIPPRTARSFFLAPSSPAPHPPRPWGPVARPLRAGPHSPAAPRGGGGHRLALALGLALAGRGRCSLAGGLHARGGQAGSHGGAAHVRGARGAHGRPLVGHPGSRRHPGALGGGGGTRAGAEVKQKQAPAGQTRAPVPGAVSRVSPTPSPPAGDPDAASVSEGWEGQGRRNRAARRRGLCVSLQEAN